MDEVASSMSNKPDHSDTGKSVQDAASEIRRSQVRRALNKKKPHSRASFVNTRGLNKQVVQKTFIWPEINLRRKLAFGAPAKKGASKGKGRDHRKGKGATNL